MTAANPLESLQSGALAPQYRALGLDRLSDGELFAQVAAIVARPKQTADSFVLHAPLEILARYRLLALVAPDQRELARLRLVSVARRYATTGQPAPTDATLANCADVEALLAAIEAGESDRAQALGAALAEALPPDGLTSALATPVLQRLGAAAHGHLFFYLIDRVDAAAQRAAAPLLANFARELATDHLEKLSWTQPGETAGPDRSLDTASLENALLNSPLKPFAGFLCPIMQAAERAGIPAAVVGGPLAGPIGPEAAEAAFAAICRAAALAMIEERPREAKYGWTHAFTLPFGVWEIAGAIPDQAFALRVAATYFLGLRAAVGRKRRLIGEPDLEPRPPALPQALAKSPKTAAASAWTTAPERQDEIFALLATEASIRTDAHLVKYVLACRDAAQRDASPVYRAAAAYLTALWMSEETLRDVKRELGVA